jgi:hypothetical protein
VDNVTARGHGGHRWLRDYPAADGGQIVARHWHGTGGGDQEQLAPEFYLMLHGIYVSRCCRKARSVAGDVFDGSLTGGVHAHRGAELAGDGIRPRMRRQLPLTMAARSGGLRLDLTSRLITWHSTEDAEPRARCGKSCPAELSEPKTVDRVAAPVRSHHQLALDNPSSIDLPGSLPTPPAEVAYAGQPVAQGDVRRSGLATRPPAPSTGPPLSQAAP